MKNIFLSGIFFLLLFSFAGCKDDEADGPNGAEENKPPVANAGADITGNTGSTIVLNGDGSQDPDEDELTYLWAIKTKPEASKAVITNKDKVSASFVPDVAGNYTIELTVSDGKLSDTDEVLAQAEGAPLETVIVNSDITQETVWEDIFTDPLIPDYLVESNVAVKAKLTVQPGVVVHFKDEAALVIETGGGSLIAQGAENKRILFTSANEAGEVLWKGILVKSSSTENKIEYADITFGGGGDMVYADGWRRANIGIAENGKLGISNSTISRSGADGIFVVQSGSLTTFSNNIFSSNADFPLSLSINEVGSLNTSNTFNEDENTARRETVIRIYDSVLKSDQVWSDVGSGVSLRFVGDPSVEAKLTINEGVKMEFDQGVIMRVKSEGTLIAKGSEDKKVIFTSSDIGAGKKWGGILIESSSVQNELSHAEVLHAGGQENLMYFQGWRGGNIALGDNAKLSLTNSVIAHSSAHGLVLHGSAALPAFEENYFHDNEGYPVLLSANMAGMADAGSVFENNSDNVVAIYGSELTDKAAFGDQANPKWLALGGEARYLVTGDLKVNHNLILQEGATLTFADGVVMEVTKDGSFKAAGTADKKVVLTAYEQDGNHNWGGIVYRSLNSNNVLQNAEVSYAGNADNLIYTGSGGWKSANIALDSKATLNISSTAVTNSQGHGIALHDDSEITIGEGVTFGSNGLSDVYQKE